MFVRHDPVRVVRHVLARHRRRTPGLAGPAVLAIALAVAGHQLPTAESPREAVAGAATGSAATRAAVNTRALESGASDERADRPLGTATNRAAARASRSAPRRQVVRRTGSEWVRPARGPLTSPYGYRWGRLHKGIDIGASYGAPIFAVADGVVTYAGPEGGYGRLVTIRHKGGVVTAYGHMSRYAVRSGQRVRAGQVIAYVGSAGLSTGAHLHFEVRPGGGFPINPLPFLRARNVRI